MVLVDQRARAPPPRSRALRSRSRARRPTPAHPAPTRSRNALKRSFALPINPCAAPTCLVHRLCWTALPYPTTTVPPRPLVQTARGLMDRRFVRPRRLAPATTPTNVGMRAVVERPAIAPSSLFASAASSSVLLANALAHRFLAPLAALSALTSPTVAVSVAPVASASSIRTSVKSTTTPPASKRLAERCRLATRATSCVETGHVNHRAPSVLICPVHPMFRIAARMVYV